MGKIKDGSSMAKEAAKVTKKTKTDGKVEGKAKTVKTEGTTSASKAASVGKTAGKGLSKGALVGLIGGALVVVIIIAAVLVAVKGGKSENGETGGGLFGNSEQKQGDLAEKVQVGDYIQYEPNVEGEYVATKDVTGVDSRQVFQVTGKEEWRVLAVDEETGTVQITTKDPVMTKSGSGLTISGAVGITNFLDDIQNVAEIYGTGEGASEVRAMTIEDVYGLVGWDNLADRYGLDAADYTSQEELQTAVFEKMNTRYGEHGTVTNQENFLYPTKEGQAEKTEFEIRSTVKMPMDGSACNIIQRLKLEKLNSSNTMIKSLLSGNQWLANTYEDYLDSYTDKKRYAGKENEKNVCWGAYMMSDQEIVTADMFINLKSSKNTTKFGGTLGGVRPVVTLKKSMSVASGSGTSSDPWKMK